MERQPVLLCTIDDPVVELRVGGNFLINKLSQPEVIVLKQRDAITVGASGLGKDGVLLQWRLLLETENAL